MSDEHSIPDDRPVGEEQITPDGFEPLGPTPIGPWELSFTTAVKNELGLDPTVLRAYLAVCRFNKGRPEVALCLVFADAVDEASVLRCQQVFYGMFASTESLAVFPIAPNGLQEQALRSVRISPFFTQGAIIS
jgi:hypothetical protein